MAVGAAPGAVRAAALAEAEQRWLDIEDELIQTAGKLAQAEAEVEKLTWQMEKAARIAGIDLSELDEAWAERGGGK